MKDRIYRDTVRIVLASIAIFSLIFAVGLYFVFTGHFQNQLRTELELLAGAMNAAEDPETLFALWSGEGAGTRLTLIAQDGTVLADTEAEAGEMENHAGRPEVGQALETGFGSARRQSPTLDEMTYYVAQRLDDGNVLRLAGDLQSVVSVLLGAFLCVFLAAPLTLLASSVMAERTTRAIIRPIDALNLDKPSENEIYDEFAPLLARLSVQNRRIESQMRELSRRQTEFAAITASMSEGLVILNARAEVLSMNDAARRIFRVGDADYTGRYVLALHRCPELMRAIRGAQAGKPVTEQMRTNGRVYQLIASPVREGDGTAGMLLLIPDVTERVEAERNRREFSANVSHELKTPLTSIMGCAELLRSGIVREEDVAKFSGQIYDSAQRLLRLVEDIIHLSRLDEGAPVAMAEMDLAEVAKEVCGRLQSTADDAGIPLRQQLKSAKIVAARQMMDELISNLVDNAIKYNRPGGDVTVEVEPLGDGARLTVRDTGIGIDSEHHAKIFERFYRVDKSHSREIGGTGLGLSIVKHIAALHQASIDIDSELGQGTQITVIFPAEPEA